MIWLLRFLVNTNLIFFFGWLPRVTVWYEGVYFVDQLVLDKNFSVMVGVGDVTLIFSGDKPIIMDAKYVALGNFELYGKAGTFVEVTERAKGYIFDCDFVNMGVHIDA